MKPAGLLKAERFPRSSRYNPEWILAGVSGGANPLWLTEWLTEAMDLRPEMRVLDLSCGRAMSSIFLHREFGVQVWAVDLWNSAAENLQRIRDAGVADGVFPIHADARSLPFAADFFDAIVSIDSFFYYGTDDLYLENIARFVKPGGLIAIAGAGLMREFHDAVPAHLRAWWIPETPDINCLHSAPWWKSHWARSGLIDVVIADTMPDGWKYWSAWHKAVAPDNALEIQALEADQGQCLSYVRAIGHRRAGIKIANPIVSIPEHYEQKPLLRPTE
jgi:SAM-dependent methyltransferase